ncbi:TIR domain-containing protein [Saccharothrix sp. NRRL B-16348]|uniref:TIR domain-containing protein n=1 Tax=Saccharothrix sp. NRRL B-16348 TaxID=1415542 RepID=UPI0018D066E4|nr:TIR domain-containing protein [Saccharothrix sp. NRRL B-16348]
MEQSGSVGETRSRYDVFLSYSHAADGQLAPALQRGLQRLARRWNQIRALRVFRDQESLAANPDLWTTIGEALRGSRYFVLLASPEAARSPWVGREVGLWRDERERETFLIALTGGDIVWDDVAGDFDWARTTALPEALRGWFTAEPLWVDLSWARDPAELSVRHSRFRFDVATLAAPVHGTAREELDSEDVRRHRVGTWVRRGVAAALAALLVAVLGLGTWTILQQRDAIEQGQRAVSRAVAAKSELMADTDPELSRLLAVAAWRVRETPEAAAAMLSAATRPGVGRIGGGGDSVGAVAFSPDGRTLATGGEGVRLWDVTTRQQVGEDITEHAAAVSVVAFSPDGRSLVTSGGDQSVRLFDVGTRDRIGTPHPKPEDSPWMNVAMRAAFRPDGAEVAVGEPGDTVALWNVGTRARVAQIKVAPSDPRTMPNPVPPSVAYHPNGSVLATIGADGVVRFWDTTSHGQVGDPLAAHPANTASLVGPVMAFAPDGSLFATAGTDGTIRIWDTATRRPVGAPLTGHTRPDRVTLSPSLAFSPDGRVLAAGSEDGTVRLWDVRGRRLLGEPLTGHTRAVASVAFSPDGRMLASGARDGTARLWDVAERLQLAHPALEHTGQVFALAFSPDGKTLATGSDNGEAAGDHGSKEACGHNGWGVCSVDNGRVTVIGGGSMVMLYDPPGTVRPAPTGPPRTVALWDVAERRPAADMPTRTRNPVLAVAFSPDGRTLVSGGLNDRGDGATLWDVAGRAPLGDPLADQLGVVRSAAFSPDGTTLVTAGQSGGVVSGSGEAKAVVSFWKAGNRELLGTVDAGDAVFATAFTPDGTVVATGSRDGIVRLWDVAERRIVGEPLTGHTGPVGALAFTPDGRTLASAGDDGVIRLWDVATRTTDGEPLVGHTGAVYSLAFDRDGRTLASGGGDNSVRLWNMAARKQISAPHVGHSQPVRAVAFSPDGTLLASAGEDNAVRFWDASFTTDTAARLCATARRSLTPEEWARHLPDAPFRQVCP